MTAAQIYSNNYQSKRCVQVLHEVARHVASWVRADGPERVPESFLSRFSTVRRTASRRVAAAQL